MGLLSIPELQAILEPHLVRFGRVIWPVLNTYQEMPTEYLLQFGSITQANIMHSFMVANARREFQDVHGVSFIEGPNETLYVRVDGPRSRDRWDCRLSVQKTRQRSQVEQSMDLATTTNAKQQPA